MTVGHYEEIYGLLSLSLIFIVEKRPHFVQKAVPTRRPSSGPLIHVDTEAEFRNCDMSREFSFCYCATKNKSCCLLKIQMTLVVLSVVLGQEECDEIR